MTQTMWDEEKLNEYVLSHSGSEDPVLHDLYRETHLSTVYPRMLSGPVQGKFLEFISSMIRPVNILEIGTFTGYSAICLAKGLAEGGVLHTIDINDEIEEIAVRYFKRAGLDHCIKLHIGDACEVIDGLKTNFDLVFIDADKEQYIRYYNTVFPYVKTGGFILADNVLWGGKVLEEETDNKETAGIKQFNKMIMEDQRIEKLLLPLRDGIYILRKNSR